MEFNIKALNAARYRKILWSIWIYFIIIILNIIIGSWNTGSKYCVHYFSAMVVVGVRFTFGTPAVFVITVYFENKFPRFRSSKDVFTFAIAGTILYVSQALYILGLGYTTVGNGSILNLCIPILSTILAIVFRVDRFGFQKLLGVVVCAVGVALIFYENKFAFDNWTKGNILVLMSGLCFACYALFLQKRLLPRYKPLVVTSWCFFFATIPSFIFGVLFMDYSIILIVPALVWIIFIYGVVVVTACGNLLYNWCLSQASPVIVTSFMFIQPIAGIVFANYFLNESILLFEVLGGVVITAGLFLVLWAQEKRLLKQRREEKQLEIIAKDEAASVEMTVITPEEKIGDNPEDPSIDKYALRDDNGENIIIAKTSEKLREKRDDIEEENEHIVIIKAGKKDIEDFEDNSAHIHNGEEDIAYVNDEPEISYITDFDDDQFNADLM